MANKCSEGDSKFGTEAIVALAIAAGVQLTCFKAVYLGLAVGVPFAAYCVLRRRFCLFPALIILYARASSITIIILLCSMLAVLYTLNKQQMKMLLHFPDVLIFPLLFWTISMLFPACERSGFHWLEKHYEDLYSVLGLFGFYYGMLIYRTYKPSAKVPLFGAALFALALETLNRMDDDADKALVRTIFLWGPFFGALLVNGIQKIRPQNIFFGLLGSMLFVVVMLMGLPTLTLQGSMCLAGFFTVLGSARNVISRAVACMVTSWGAFFVAILVMAYGVHSLEDESLARDRNSSAVAGEYKFAQFDAEFFDRLRAKVFDDRATLWRACYWDITTPPFFWRPLDETQIRFYEDSLGRVDMNYTIAPHNVFLGVILHLRWGAGLLFLILYMTMITRAGKVLWASSGRKEGLWTVTSASVVAIGVFGGTTGDFPILHSFNMPFFALAGLCYAHHLDNSNVSK